MMEVNLQSHDLDIGRDVAEICARFGHVASVKVHREPSAFALIEMKTREQTADVAARYGGSVFGTCALIHLRHGA